MNLRKRKITFLFLEFHEERKKERKKDRNLKNKKGVEIE